MSPRKGPLVVVGDTLLDRDLIGTVTRLCPDAPAPLVDDPVERVRPGGAGLAALLAAKEGEATGREVVLVTALGDGAAAEALRELLSPYVRLVELPYGGTVAEKTRVVTEGRSLLRMDRGGEGPVGPPGREVEEVLARAAAVLVSDYGRGVAADPGVRGLLAELAGRVPVVWDPHPRGPLPVAGAALVTPNHGEARRAVETGPGTGKAGTESADGPGALRSVAGLAAALCDRWRARAVCVTLGARGALLSRGAEPFVVPAPVTAVADPCGAGDRFAAAVTGRLADGAAMPEAVTAAVHAAAAFLASGGVATITAALADGTRTAPDGTVSTSGRGTSPAVPEGSGPAAPGGSAGTTAEAVELLGRVRAAGGTVVATGGCFDLLHAGHIRTLQAARALGDCLIVCLNSDRSVRALKGPPRPFNPAGDRAEVLLALGCVDAVVVFDEATPERLLGVLRPDVWVKGGDYCADALPEAALVASYGGQAVTVPYLAGRSTTRMAEAAAGPR